MVVATCLSRLQKLNLFRWRQKSDRRLGGRGIGAQVGVVNHLRSLAESNSAPNDHECDESQKPVGDSHHDQRFRWCIRQPLGHRIAVMFQLSPTRSQASTVQTVRPFAVRRTSRS